jgi:hypothetical protein
MGVCVCCCGMIMMFTMIYLLLRVHRPQGDPLANSAVDAFDKAAFVAMCVALVNTMACMAANKWCLLTWASAQ